MQLNACYIFSLVKYFVFAILANILLISKKGY